MWRPATDIVGAYCRTGVTGPSNLPVGFSCAAVRFSLEIKATNMADAGKFRSVAFMYFIFIYCLLLGFFKGTSADQDRRFSDKELKLLKSMKFPPEFEKKVSHLHTSVHIFFPSDVYLKVDMRKVNLQVIRPWIVNKVVELVGFEDEVVVEYAMGLLEDNQEPVRSFYLYLCFTYWDILITPDSRS